MFQRRSTLVWIWNGCLGVRLPICNPLVDGVGDAMLCAIRDFFAVCHRLGANINEWVKVTTAKTELASDRHV